MKRLQPVFAAQHSSALSALRYGLPAMGYRAQILDLGASFGFLPRSMGSGAWKYHDMIGYTSVGAGSSVVPVRFNCPPAITLHHLHLSS